MILIKYEIYIFMTSPIRYFFFDLLTNPVLKTLVPHLEENRNLFIICNLINKLINSIYLYHI